jgi:hypothetical protein
VFGGYISSSVSKVSLGSQRPVVELLRVVSQAISASDGFVDFDIGLLAGEVVGGFGGAFEFFFALEI